MILVYGLSRTSCVCERKFHIGRCEKGETKNGVQHFKRQIQHITHAISTPDTHIHLTTHKTHVDKDRRSAFQQTIKHIHNNTIKPSSHKQTTKHNKHRGVPFQTTNIQVL